MSPFFGAAEIAGMMAGPLAVCAVVDGTPTRGFWDDSEAWVTGATGDEVKIRTRTLLVLADCPVPPFDAVVEVGGALYRVRSTMLADDGGLLTIMVVPSA